ncbi:putative inactive LRR receptor-like protein kinase [Heracleum sosnowskyi]|uniref:Inactive LRR receptor-like protein kinase n=1 Tax=Heracleum sosnowskyi TaxID=360622 RepID=A0AAD8HYF2_9APIA|nr:putative inactive LRR receptor-like protein kinase [Heracleum sosnowskyi]
MITHITLTICKYLKDYLLAVVHATFYACKEEIAIRAKKSEAFQRLQGIPCHNPKPVKRSVSGTYAFVPALNLLLSTLRFQTNTDQVTFESDLSPYWFKLTALNSLVSTNLQGKQYLYKYVETKIKSGTEFQNLLSIKSFIRDPFDFLSSWNSSTSFCNWKGITCDNSSHVTKVELSGKNISGTISESFFQLPFIQVIDLSNNQFEGGIPSEIPEEIGLFTSLKALDLGGNALVGKIPKSIINLTNLQYLTLASNELVGEIPSEIGLMKNLKLIYLGYNNLSGQIPVSLGELSSLNHLNLVSNNLTGEVPSSLGNLTNLEYFFLYLNSLSGSIPHSIFNLQRLKSLDFSDNLLSGEIPELIGQLNNLQILHLFSNNLTGKIPKSVTFLPHLQVLQLWSNKLSGELPQSLGHCTSLQRIRLQNNQFSGQLSSDFIRLPRVYFLDISGNKLSGRISERTWTMPELEMLNLSRNRFFGNLPDSFGSENLENVDLSENDFSGKIPPSFGNFSELVQLKLTYCLGKVESLVQVNISHNHFHGSLPSTGAFVAIKPSAVAGNNLCGGSTSGLWPCKGLKTSAWWFLLSCIVAALAVLGVSAFVILLLVRRKKMMNLQRMERSEDGSWELQFMHDKAYKSTTIDDILSSVRDENIIVRGKLGNSYVGKSSLATNMQFLINDISSISPSQVCEFYKLQHPNIAKLVAICMSAKGGYLVYEYVEGKILSEIIFKLSWENRKNIAVGIAKALKHVHSHCSPSTLACEISSDKIMVYEKDEPCLRLTFSGIASSMDTKCFLSSSAYISSESRETKGTTEKSNMYGFGLLLIELLTGRSSSSVELGGHESIVEWARYCYSDCHLETWVDPIIKASALNHHSQIVETMNLALQCTASDPVVRPCAKDLVKTLKRVMISSSCVLDIN